MTIQYRVVSMIRDPENFDQVTSVTLEPANGEAGVLILSGSAVPLWNRNLKFREGLAIDLAGTVQADEHDGC